MTDDEIRARIDIPVHPAAAVFPMLPYDELRELADDIKANGLHHPIVLDDQGRIVDGRNRYVACKLAGIEPTFVTLPADVDVYHYVLSENIYRRHLSKGQQAMAIAAMIETEEGKRDGQTKRLMSDSDISRPYVVAALTIRRYAEDLAGRVLGGLESFDAAYKTALARKQVREDEATANARTANADRIRLERLARSHPEIAALVPDTLNLAAAEAAAAQEARRLAAEIEAQSRLMDTALNALDPGSRALPCDKAALIASRLDPTSLPVRPDFTVERIARARDTLAALVVLLEGQEAADGRSPESL